MLFALQAVGLILFSVHLWDRYDLTTDFATFFQAWHQIGTGHLDPRLTTFAYDYPNYGYLFWQSHFELLMWPLALLEPIFRSSLTLLVIQDLALAGSGLVATRWGLELAGRRRSLSPTGVALVGSGLVVLLLIDPWTYWSAAFDFHFQPLACLFVLLAGRDLASGRRRAWLWVVLVVACGDVAATYLVALGVSVAVAGRGRRRPGARAGRRAPGTQSGSRRLTGVALAATGVVTLGVVSLLGSGKASTLSASYGYLADGHPVDDGLSGIATIVAGIARHPSVGWHILSTRRPQIFKYLAATGTLGVISAVALPMAVIVLGANGLNAAPNFVGAAASFQSLVVVLFGSLGAVSVVVWLAGRGGRVAVVAAVVVGLAMMAQAVVVSAHWTPKVRSFLLVPAGTAHQLDAVRRTVPAGAEVVVSQGVIGRFGGHRWVYAYLNAFGDGQTVPLRATTVVFVFTDVGIEAATPAQTAAAVALVSALPGVRRLPGGAGVEAFRWAVPAGRRSLTFAP